MKKAIILLLAALPIVAKAQMPGMPGGFQMSQMQDLPEETIVAQTESMVAEYGLNEEQAEQLLTVNKKYLGKISYPVVMPPQAEEAMQNAAANRPAGGAGAAGFDPNSMSQEDRDNMMEMMQKMQEMMNSIEDNQEEYEKFLSSIFDKKQFKKFKKAKKHYQTDQQIMMERQFGGFGGGMPDFGGGGFGGGFPGGGGFGGGFPGGF